MSKGYRIKEIHLTLQGEGANTGMAVILLRFEGCNLSCDYCDTDFHGTDGESGGVYRSPGELAEAVERKWNSDSPLNVLCTGGEPLLQLDLPLIGEFHRRGFTVSVETNGSISVPHGVDWICVSPKTNEIPAQSEGNEIKIVWPQKNIQPETFENLPFTHFWIQPKFDKDYSCNLKTAISYCLTHPKWRLSLQTHRLIGIP
ncbi:MAG: 7-carboxy-7-deazaguanine synthase [bacterium]|nr:7-carboxy-7-deazaguanine synthase [bacterium]